MKAHLVPAVALLLGACTAADQQDSEAEPDGGPVSAAQDTVSISARPQTREDTIRVEGTPQIERAVLFRAPADFGIPFSTYVPEGIRAELRDADPGASVRFTAAFAGVENPNAYMQIHVYPPGTQRPTVDDVVTGFVRSRAPGIDETTGTGKPDWALDALHFSYVGTGSVRTVGSVMTAQHEGRFFHVIAHYPAEYGDGMGPRIDYILRHWRWEDTGDMLVR